MKFHALALVFATTAASLAADSRLLVLRDWRIERGGGELQVAHTDKAIVPFPLELDGGEPKLLACEVAKENPRIGLLTYYSGTAGTSAFYRFTRVIVLDLEKRKILGIALKTIKPAGNEPSLRQPEWK
jgi:hypothetical protein